MKKFKNKNGSLNQYALACGYYEKTQIDEFGYIIMYFEYGAYHVRWFYNKDNKNISDWKTYGNIINARKFYKDNGGKFIK